MPSALWDREDAGSAVWSIEVSDLRRQLLASLQPQELAALSDSVIEPLARRLVPYIPQVPCSPEPTGWLEFDGALQYLDMKKGTLHKLTSARTIPFHQDGPGCELWFLRSELDQWRQNSGARSPRSTHLKAA